MEENLFFEKKLSVNFNKKGNKGRLLLTFLKYKNKIVTELKFLRVFL